MADGLMHFRRCHVCGAISEQNEVVEKCMDCGKHISPFFYFNDRTVRISENEIRPPVMAGGFVPLIGLTAYWPGPD